MGAVLSKKEILNLLDSSSPLIQGLIERDTQIGENGVDLTVRRVSKFVSEGAIDFSNQEREISEVQDLEFDKMGWIRLEPGAFRVEYNEIINLPKDIVGIAMPRSSLIRCGVALVTSFWDAGYHGRGKSTIVIFNLKGFRMKKDSRIAQLAFLFMKNHSEKGYQGTFQREDIG